MSERKSIRAPEGKPERKRRRQLDLTGQRFGRLVANSPARCVNGDAGWLCSCDCGRTSIVSAWLLRKKPRGIRSCGCRKWLGTSRPRHGMSKTKVYRAWIDMRTRCYRPSCSEYLRYGGRGITVCERWRVFENFYADMGDPPSSEHSLERSNVNGNYEPGNCCWATPEEQINNLRKTKRLTVFGETKSMAQWARDSRCVVGIDTLKSRISRGMEHESAISTPSSRGR